MEADTMITSFNIVTSLRVYLTEKYGIPTVIKQHGWKVPESKPFFTVKDYSNLYNRYGKENEIVQGIVPIEFGIHADTLRDLSKLHSDILTEVLYGVIPLLDSEGKRVGEFSFKGIEADSEVINDVESVEYETARNRRYIEAHTHITYIKQYK